MPDIFDRVAAEGLETVGRKALPLLERVLPKSLFEGRNLRVPTAPPMRAAVPVVAKVTPTLSKVAATTAAPTARPPGFYSKLEEVVNAKMGGKAPVDQLRKMLKGQGVTDAEMENVLGGLEGVVTKQQVLDELKVNGTEFKDVVLGRLPEQKNVIGLTLKDPIYDPATSRQIGLVGDKITPEMLNAITRLGGGTRGFVNTFEQGRLPVNITDTTKFASYQEPGAIPGSYREMFVTAPKDFIGSSGLKGPREVVQQYMEGMLTYDEAVAKGMSGQVRDNLREGMWNDGHSAYSDIHNPIVRIRFNDRTVNGKKILFVEEMQGPGGDTKYIVRRNRSAVGLTLSHDVRSLTGIDIIAKKGDIVTEDLLKDLEQRGREVINTVEKGAIRFTLDEGMTKFDAKKVADEFVAKDGGTVEKIVEGEQGKMPPHLQSRIYDIGVKRTLAYAKANGYDGVAWTFGERQASRYDLSKHLDTVHAVPRNDGQGYFIVGTKGKKEVIRKDVPTSQLDQNVGKDLATKIMENNGGDFSGLDLKVGGEGLKSVYDKTLPEKFKKYGKEEVKGFHHQLSTETGKAVEGHYIPITSKTPTSYPYWALAPALALGAVATPDQAHAGDIFDTVASREKGDIFDKVAAQGTKGKGGAWKPPTAASEALPELNFLEGLTNPLEAVGMALTGGALALPKLATIGVKGVVKETADWALQGLPSLLKGLSKGAQALVRGASAKALEATVPVAGATPIHVPIPRPNSATTIIINGQAVPYVGAQLTKADLTAPPKPSFLMSATDRLREQELRRAGLTPGKPGFMKSAEDLLRTREALQGAQARQVATRAKPTPPPPPPVEPLHPIVGVTVPPQSPVDHFVDLSPLRFDPNASAVDIRATYSGAKNLQWVKGNFLAEDLRKLVPNKLDREALTLWRDAGGDDAKLTTWRQDEKLKQYWPTLDRALTLSDEARQGNATILEPYFKATGDTGLQYGFLNDVKDNYINRMFPQPQKTGLPKRLLKSQTVEGSRITDVRISPELPQSTYHAKPRQFDHLLDRVAVTGEHPITLDSADLLRLFNREFGTTLANVKLLNTMKDTGIASTLATAAPVPQGWQRVGNSNTIIPDELHTGLRAIIEPNFMARIEGWRKMGMYQGLVKTVDLSLSFFHHFTMAMQGLYQTKFGLELALPSTQKFLKTAAFREVLEDGAKHGLMTSNIDANKDVLYKLGKSNDMLAKVVNAPGVRNVFQLLEKNNRFLFDGIQRWLKVMDYGKQTSRWMAHNMGATDEAIVVAKRGIAEEVNNAYGGLNWEVLGKTPSFQALNRAFLLAPDWTYSNYYLAKQALTSGGPGGARARSHYLSALIGGAALTEGLNHLITGHFTDKNQSGHEFDVEIPSSDPRFKTHISFFRGGIGDAMRLATLTYKYGPIAGPIAMAGGKSAPFPRTVAGLIANADWDGKLWSAQKTWTQNTLRTSAFIASSMLPIPFGVSGVVAAAWKRAPLFGDWNDPLIYLIAASGVGRVTGSAKTKGNAFAPMRGMRGMSRRLGQ